MINNILAFIAGFFREDKPQSSKRLSVVFSMISLVWALNYAMVHAQTDNARQLIINSLMIFIAVMSGVATVAQIVSLVKGSPEPSKTDDNSKQDAK